MFSFLFFWCLTPNVWRKADTQQTTAAKVEINEALFLDNIMEKKRTLRLSSP